MRQLLPHEIEILKKGNGTQFTEEEMEALKSGTASFKVYSQADRILQKQRSYLMAAISRKEAIQVFMPRRDFLPLLIRTLSGIDLLVAKGLLTEDELFTRSKEMIENKAEADKGSPSE